MLCANSVQTIRASPKEENRLRFLLLKHCKSDASVLQLEEQVITCVAKTLQQLREGVEESEEYALLYTTRDESENIVSFNAAIDDEAAELLQMQSEALQAFHSLSRSSSKIDCEGTQESERPKRCGRNDSSLDDDQKQPLSAVVQSALILTRGKF